jgi:hypothetical protein
MPSSPRRHACMKSKAPGQRSWLQVRLEVCWSALRLRRPGGFGSLGLAEAERPSFRLAATHGRWDRIFGLNYGFAKYCNCHRSRVERVRCRAARASDTSGANSQRAKPVTEDRHERARSYKTSRITVEGRGRTVRREYPEAMDLQDVDLWKCALLCPTGLLPGERRRMAASLLERDLVGPGKGGL